MALFRMFTNIKSLAEPEAYDAGLHAYVLKIYNYMAAALLLMGMMAFLAAHSDELLIVAG